MLLINRIVWNRTVYLYKNGFGVNLQRLICHKIQLTKLISGWGERKDKIHVLLENNHAAHMSNQKKKLTELPNLKHNKVFNTLDRANMKIIPTWPRVNLPRFHQMALQDHTGEVG